VTLKKSAANIPDKIMPNLNKLYDQIRTLGADLNAKIGRLENTVANQGFHAETELISMSNLKECVESAADVVSTASTTLGPEGTERTSVKYGSDFGDVFRKDANEPMQRWMSSHTVYEYDDAEAPTLDPSEASTGDAPTMYESDSDSDIEHELVRALFSNGKKRKDQGDLPGAERHLKNCLSRFPSTATASYATLASSQSTLATGVSKAELLELLTETYCLQGNWTQAKSTMKEKLAITERQTGKKSEYFFWDSFRLCEVLLNTKDYTEAQLHGRQALRGFKKLRGDGHNGYEKTLALLIQVCNEQDNPEDEEAYAALLSSYQMAHKTSLLGGELVLETEETQESSILKPIENALMSQKDAKDELILESGGSTPNLSKSADTGTQTQLRQLTPIPPITTQSDSTPLSPSSSTSAGPWSPTAQATQFRGTSLLPNDTPGEVAAAVQHTKKTEHAPKGVSAKLATVATTKDANSEAVVSSAKLLVDLCQQELGHKPIFMIGRSREGYNCIVFADETRDKTIAKAVDCRTKDEARYVAATKAYKALISTSPSSPITTARSSLTGNATRREAYASRPSSAHQIPTRSNQVDPPPYMEPEAPSNLTSPTGFLQDVPEILLSPVVNDAVIAALPPSNAAHNVLVRRAASDSRLPQHKTSTGVHTADLISSGEAYPKESSNDQSAHRRAASTSSRFPGARAGPSTASQKSFGELINTPTLQETHLIKSIVKDSKLQPNVTFDTIESSVERPDHSNPDPTTPTSRNFSLFPSSLAKTFSLQDRRSKSDHPNLAKKKSLRFGLSSRRKSSTSVLAERQTSTDIGVTKPPCPICSASLQGLSDDETWSHVDNCLGKPSPSANDFAFELPAFELPAFEPSSYAVELPASTPATDVSGLSDLHRAFSRRDLSADKFENETRAKLTSLAPRSTLRVLQRQVLLLGDPQCGKTWLSRYVKIVERGDHDGTDTCKCLV
jgi:tetratricopeptide (TPR) repeat protein